MVCLLYRNFPEPQSRVNGECVRSTKETHDKPLHEIDYAQREAKSRRRAAGDIDVELKGEGLVTLHLELKR